MKLPKFVRISVALTVIKILGAWASADVALGQSRGSNGVWNQAASSNSASHSEAPIQAVRVDPNRLYNPYQNGESDQRLHRRTADSIHPSRPLVPGSGTEVIEVADDFEAEEWSYTFNTPKIYNHEDTTLHKNLPAGISANQLWYEGPKRGQPDVIRRVPTPENGLPGSTGALFLRSLQTGGSHPSYQQQQDDFVCNFAQTIGKVPVSLSPSIVTRVYLPPIEEWERRTGCHFAFRASLDTETPLYRHASYGSQSIKIDESWPGMFVNMELKRPDPATPQDIPVRLFVWMKADQRGHQLKGPEIKQLGWWTLGMSFTPEGQVHYYARPGVEDLTEADHISSSFPYGQNAARLRNFFFNVCNGDDGRNWSTPFVVDDPKLFIVK